MKGFGSAGGRRGTQRLFREGTHCPRPHSHPRDTRLQPNDENLETPASLGAQGPGVDAALPAQERKGTSSEEAREPRRQTLSQADLGGTGHCVTNLNFIRAT